MIQASPEELAMVLDIIKALAPDCKVVAFGSRCKGTSRRNSDLDLAFIGDKKMDWRLLARIREAFADSDIPYHVDALDYRSVAPWFQSIIDRTHDLIYPPQTV
jgi:type I restriction enzyme S subunit